MRPVTQLGLEWISARRLRPWLWAALIAAWLVWLGAIALSIPLASAHSYDFDTYYAAAQALRFDHSADIYRVATLNQVAQAHGLCAHTGHFLPPYVYPPLLAILLEPLTLLPCGSAATLWLLLNAALWAAATLLLADVLARRWPGRRLAATTLVTLISLGCLPAYYGLFLGQVHLLMLAGFALTLWLVERDRPALAGAALVIIALIKLIPALLLVAYLLRGRWLTDSIELSRSGQAPGVGHVPEKLTFFKENQGSFYIRILNTVKPTYLLFVITLLVWKIIAEFAHEASPTARHYRCPRSA